MIYGCYVHIFHKKKVFFPLKTLKNHQPLPYLLLGWLTSSLRKTVRGCNLWCYHEDLRLRPPENSGED